MTTFKVQTYLPGTKDWEVVAVFKPSYRYSTMRLGPRWKPKWFKPVIGVVTNVVPGEQVAYRQALHLAKKLLKRFRQTSPVRITRDSLWTGSEVKDVVWQDGTVLISLKEIWKR